jgi:hypothetical protein
LSYNLTCGNFANPAFIPVDAMGIMRYGYIGPSFEYKKYIRKSEWKMRFRLEAMVKVYSHSKNNAFDQTNVTKFVENNKP